MYPIQKVQRQSQRHRKQSNVDHLLLQKPTCSKSKQPVASASDMATAQAILFQVALVRFIRQFKPTQGHDHRGHGFVEAARVLQGHLGLPCLFGL